MSDRLDLKDFTDSFCVSTVSLSVAHEWAGGGGYWFETYIFPAADGEITEWIEVWGTRYRTEAEARRGHAATLADVKAGQLP